MEEILVKILRVDEHRNTCAVRISLPDRLDSWSMDEEFRIFITHLKEDLGLHVIRTSYTDLHFANKQELLVFILKYGESNG